MSTESLYYSEFGRYVKPEPLHEPSFVTTVSRLINRAVPQQTGVVVKEVERIIWVAFEKCDLNDPLYKSFLRHICGSELPLIIILGLFNGFQIWACMFNGDCTELLSIRDQPVSVVKFLPSCRFYDSSDDHFSRDRPILAVLPYTRCRGGPGELNLLSLRTGLTVHTVACTEQIGAVFANSLFVVLTTVEKIRVLHAGTFEELFTLTELCLPNLYCKNCIALGTQWMAYPDCGISRTHQSFGGVSLEEPLHYSRFVNNVAKTVTRTVSELSKSVSGTVSGAKGVPLRSSPVVEKLVTEVGVVTVVDLSAFPNGAKGIRSASSICQGVVAHFAAHLDEKVGCIAFGPNGTLLITGGLSGRQFHIFNVLAHPVDSSLAAVQHLYTLYRGNTNAAVQDIAFADDCRWLAITTINGTSHIFPINPYGGPTSARTHCGNKVVNKESRFERSSGVAVLALRRSGRRQVEVPCNKKGSPVVKKFHPSVDSGTPYLNRIVQNPRLPPYSSPVGVVAVAKMKPYECLTPTDMMLSPKIRLTLQRRAAFFAPVRGLPALSDSQITDGMNIGFFTIGIDGKLSEFTINAKLQSVTGSKSNSDSCCFETSLLPAALWLLNRTKWNPCIQPPLSPSHMLIAANETVESVNGNRKVETKSSNVAHWISEIEIVSYADPHRRLWLGPQFTFKKYFDKTNSSSSVSIVSSDSAISSNRKSEPMAVPHRQSYCFLPVVVQKESAGSFEVPSELTIEVCGSWSENDYITQSEHEGTLRRDITQAMQEEAATILRTVYMSDKNTQEPSSPSAINLDYLSMNSDEESTDSSSSCHEKDAMDYPSLLDL